MSDLDQYAVFGHPIDHSLSPQIHTLFAKETGQSLCYGRRDVKPEQFESELASFLAEGGKGLNCTIPLKELAYGIAATKSPRALRAKAVNTLMLCPDGSLHGDNTDGTGLVRDLTLRLGITLQDRNILLIGAGGASRGILLPLLEALPAILTLTNRTLARAEQLAMEFADFTRINVSPLQELKGKTFDLILNATAASLTGELPELPEHLLAHEGICYDLAYGKQPTAFVEWGIKAGAARSVDGIGMLVEQAALAFELWRGMRPHTASVIETLEKGRSTCNSL
ncbi:MAG: shikimate dehydrogenase [Methylococcaceae bacterium]